MLQALKLGDTEQVEQNQAKKSKFMGIVYALASSILVPFQYMFIKKAVYLSGSQISDIRYVMQLLVMIGIAKYKRENIFGPRDQRWTLAFRGIIGAIGLISSGFAIKLIAPSDASSLIHSNVIITAIFSRIFLEEKFTLAHILSVVINITGILFISQPSFMFGQMTEAYGTPVNLTDTVNQTTIHEANSVLMLQTALGISLALTTAFFSGLLPIVVKHLLNKQVNFAVVIVYASYAGLPVAIGISLILQLTGVDSKSVKLLDSPLLLLNQLMFAVAAGAVGLASQVLNNFAVYHEEASKVSIIKSSDVFFTFIFQHFFLQIDPNGLSIAGAVLIVFASTFLILFKIADKKFPASSSKTSNSRKVPGSGLVYHLKRVIFYKF